MQIKTTAVLLAIFLAGCASPPPKKPMKWIGPGKTYDQFKQSTAYCKSALDEYTDLDDDGAYMAGQGIGGGNAGLAGLGILALSISKQNKESRFIACMNQNGFRWVPK